MSLDAVLEAGFADPVFESQSAFRALMRAMARPGHAEALAGLQRAPLPLSPVAAAVALTLADDDTPIWLDPPLGRSDEVRSWLAFHAGAPVVEDRLEASFAFVSDPRTMPALKSFALGSDAYPDRSTMLILQVEAFDEDGPLLSGPGLPGTIQFSATPLPETFWDQLRANRALFPRGVDVILAGPDAVAALPRSLWPGDA